MSIKLLLTPPTVGSLTDAVETAEQICMAEGVGIVQNVTPVHCYTTF